MRKRALFAVVFVAAVSLFVALGAGSAFAYSGFTQNCSGSGSSCHGSDGAVPVCTPGLNNGTTATYTVASPGLNEWAVFHGTTKVAGASGDISNPTFTVPTGATYTVYAVYGPAGSASSGAFTTISPAGGATNFTITPTAGANGSISPGAPQTVASGADSTFTITPAAGYHVANVLVNGQSVGAVASYTFHNVTANSTIEVQFAAGTSTFTIVPTTGPNGTISPGATQTVASGATATFTVTPAAGYYVDTLLVNGTAVPVDGRSTTYVFNNVTANATIAATFHASPTICTVTPSVVGGLGGSIIPTSTFSMPVGSSITCFFYPQLGYHVGTILVDGLAVPASALDDNGSYTFQSINKNHTISVTFALNTCNITAIASSHGSISPAGTKSVVTGGNATYSITPDAGYHITNVLVNGVSVGQITTYTFIGVSADSTVSATFAANSANYTITPSVVGGFAGWISPSAPFVLPAGSSVTFSFTPSVGYEVDAVTVDGVVVVPSAIDDNGSYTFTAPTAAPTALTANHTISVSFKLTPPVLTYTLHYAAGVGGIVTGARSQTVNSGSAGTAVTAAANSGYHFVSWSDGLATATRCDTNVTGDLSVTATFASTLVATKLTMNVNPTTLKLGRSAHFFGVIAPNVPDRTPIRLMVRKAGQTKWTNLAPYVRTFGGYHWSFYYHPNTHGTYYFKVQFAGTAQFLGTTSRTVKVVWK